MQTVTKLATRRVSFVARLFWAVLLALLGMVLWATGAEFLMGLVVRWPVLGSAITVLSAVLLCIAALFAVRELAALARLRRIDKLRHQANEVRAQQDGPAARRLAEQLMRLYSARSDMAWGQSRLAELDLKHLDFEGVLRLAEQELILPLDSAAQSEIEVAARQVATVTALVPLAFADVAVALVANIRMIRRIAEIYGGRSGLFGGWRLIRAVIAHLVTTGAIAIGDDLLEPVLGGSLLSKLSRRFGEGLVNGALTARVGVAAMEVCRPLPFVAAERPRVRSLVRQALTGLVSSK